MRMPGFTAEVTLYPRHQAYRGQTYSGSSEQAVILQRIYLGGTEICYCDSGGLCFCYIDLG
jgi:hypothetical protein